MRLHSLKILFTFIFSCLCSFASAQYKVPEKPAVLFPVYDENNLLTQQEKEQLNNKLIKFSDSTSTEIEVIIIPSTNGQDINFLATEFGEKWGIGQKDIDNGFVFLIAKDDRTMSIQQGRAGEQYLTASVAGQIIDYIVSPKFKQGLWYEGINGGTSAIMDAVQGKFKPIAHKKSENSGVVKTLMIAFVIFIILIIFFRNKGGGNDDDGDIMLGRRGRRNYPGGFFPFPGSFGGGGFGGGSSGGGGGFGGFGGGGSFGGGGASGGW